MQNKSPQEKLNVAVAAAFIALSFIVLGAIVIRLVRWIIGF